MIKKYEEEFTSVGNVVCHCSRHKPGCGCTSIERARNNFSLILSLSESAEEFTTKMRVLARHSCDEHEWNDGRCDFHPLWLCCCNECDDGDDLKCEGKDYHTRYALTCPFHSLPYEIECHTRAKMSDQLVHKRSFQLVGGVPQCVHLLQTETHPPGVATLWFQPSWPYSNPTHAC